MKVTPNHLYQWDHNQRIVLEGVAAGTEVHYSCPGFDGGPVLVAYDEDGIIYADFPNEYLTRTETVRVWLHIDDGKRGTTVYSASINVKPKVKPDDYVYTPTEVLRWETLEERVKALEDGANMDAILEATQKALDAEKAAAEALAQAEQAAAAAKNSLASIEAQ